MIVQRCSTKNVIDAEKMMTQWMSAGVQGFGDIQKAFMEQFAKAQTGGDKE